jgi:hypothetical protein
LAEFGESEMKKTHIFILVLLLSLPIGQMDDADARAFSGLPPSAEDLLHGETPDKGVKNWTRIITLTPRSRPSPIIFVSPTNFDVRSPQKLIFLSHSQYRSFSRVSWENRCKFDSDYKPSQVLEVSQRSTGKDRILCKMSLDSACRYLDEIATIKSIDWNIRKWAPLWKVRSILGCR